MPTLNLDPEFPKHPKTLKLARIAGPTAPYCLIVLWCHTLKHHPDDGSLAGYDIDDIESVAGWTGERGLFVKSLLSSRFLDDDYVMHDWHEHEAHLKAYRDKARKMNAARRQRSGRGSDNQENNQDNYVDTTVDTQLQLQSQLHNNSSLREESPATPIENSSTSEPSPEEMRNTLAPIMGWVGGTQKEVNQWSYTSAVLDWLCGIYPDLPRDEDSKTLAGKIVKLVSVNAFNLPDRYQKSWLPVSSFIEFLKLSIGEPQDCGGLVDGRKYPEKPKDMYRFVGQIFTNGVEASEYAHEARRNSGVA